MLVYNVFRELLHVFFASQYIFPSILMNREKIEKLFPQIYINHKVDVFKHVSDEVGYGVVATENIQIGELLVFIPFDACIIAESEIFLTNKIAKSVNNTPWSEYISFIMHSNVLSHVPVLWSDHSSLKGSLKFLLDSIVGDLSDIPKWAAAYMLSRSFEIERPGGSPSIASVPVADLFNHSTLDWNTRIRQCEDGFRFFAEKNIFSGTQIFNNYGIDDQILMFLTHGFIDDGLKEDVLSIPVSLVREDNDEGSRDEDILIRIEVEEEKCFEFLDTLPESWKPRAVDRMKRTVEKQIEEFSRLYYTSENVFLQKIYKSEKNNLEIFHRYLFSAFP